MSKSKLLNLDFPYDWSNPEISDDALIINVLKREIYPDICKICAHFGLAKVKSLSTDAEDESLERMLRNVEISFTANFSRAGINMVIERNSAPQLKERIASIAHQVHIDPTFQDLISLRDAILNGVSLHDILLSGPCSDPSCSFEYGKTVLIGDVPIELGDGQAYSDEEIKDTFQFFREKVDEYEWRIARGLFSEIFGNTLPSTEALSV